MHFSKLDQTPPLDGPDKRLSHPHLGWALKGAVVPAKNLLNFALRKFAFWSVISGNCSVHYYFIYKTQRRRYTNFNALYKITGHAL